MVGGEQVHVAPNNVLEAKWYAETRIARNNR